MPSDRLPKITEEQLKIELLGALERFDKNCALDEERACNGVVASLRYTLRNLEGSVGVTKTPIYDLVFSSYATLVPMLNHSTGQVRNIEYFKTEIQSLLQQLRQIG